MIYSAPSPPPGYFHPKECFLCPRLPERDLIRPFGRSASLDSSFARVFLPSFAQLWGFAKNLRRIGGKNISCARRKKTKKTSENAAALCAFAPLREKYPRQKTLFVQSPTSGALSRRNDGTGQVPLTRRRALSSLMPWTHDSLHNLCLQANIRFATYCSGTPLLQSAKFNGQATFVL